MTDLDQPAAVAVEDLEHLEHLRSRTRGLGIKPGIKLILCSGYDERELVQRMSRLGLAGFVQKPFSLARLREVLKKAGAEA